MAAVEKIIMKLDTVYDVLTSLDKIGQVTDIPIEEDSGINLDELPAHGGLSIQVNDLRYRFQDTNRIALDKVSFELRSSEHVCLAGYNGSGKTTLINLLLGLLPSYEGSIAYNGISLRDLHTGKLRSLIGDNISIEQIFDGTFMDNITLGRQLPLQDVLWAIELAGLTDFVHMLPEGLHSYLTGGSMRLPGSVARKIVMARSLVQKPKLLMVNDFWVGMEKREKMRFLGLLMDSKTFDWTILIVSNDRDVMQLCDRTLLLKDGKIVASGNYETIREHALFRDLTDITL